jgi:hypothetical protein
MTVEDGRCTARLDRELSLDEISPSSHDAKISLNWSSSMWKTYHVLLPFWGVMHSQEGGYEMKSLRQAAQSSLLGVQGAARLRLDIALR